MIKVATMCSGIGSPEQSLKELGIPHENIFACEKDKFARQTYLANFSPGIIYEDMTIESWDKPEQYVDLIVAGIPCQSFSLAGKRKGENDPRGLLIYDFIRYIKNQMPKVFIIENVKGLLSDQGGKTFQKWCELLGHNKNGQSGLFNNSESCGYNLHYRVLNAKHYGLPQNRERIFIIGIRPDLKDTFKWPKPIILKDRLIDLLEPEVDEKYYLSDTTLKGIIETNNKNSERANGFFCDFIDPETTTISRSNRAGYGKMSGDTDFIKHPRLNGFKESENAIRGIKSDCSGIQEMFYNKPNGISGTISKSHKPKVIQLNPSKESGGVQPYHQNRIYDSEQLSPAIDTKAGKTTESHVVDNYRIRRLTPLECMRFMGFPDEFVKPCSSSQTYKQAGNSIPVHMMKAILKEVVRVL